MKYLFGLALFVGGCAHRPPTVAEHACGAACDVWGERNRAPMPVSIYDEGRCVCWSPNQKGGVRHPVDAELLIQVEQKVVAK